MTPEPLPDWLRQLLHDLYHPLGKRRMAQTFGGLAAAVSRLKEAAERMTDAVKKMGQ